MKKNIGLAGLLEKFDDERKFKPSTKLIPLVFKILNKNIFNNKLKFMPKIYLKRIHGALGYFEYNPYAIKYCNTITLNNKFLNFREFASILGHEMVHFYQQNNLELNSVKHNKDFYKFKKKFDKLGLDLQRLYR